MPNSNDKTRNAQLQQASTPEPHPIKLALIRAYETDTQLREDIDHTHVDDLKDYLDDLPPITLFQGDDGAYNIGDGWHRYHAFANSNRREIPAIVHPGGKAAALRYALGANAEHNALRRTNRDKRKSVLACLKSHSAIFGTEKIKNVDVAEVCKVAESFVRKIRKEQEKSSTPDPSNPSHPSDPATGADPQQDFFDDLNQTFKPVAEGWKTCINHSFFLRPDIPKKEKLNALDELDRQLADHRAQLKAARAKIEAQEESEAPQTKSV